MSTETNTPIKVDRLKLRSISPFLIIFSLVMTLLTAFVAIPKFNETFEALYKEDLEVKLELEAKLFLRFIEGQKIILEDLANFPNLTNAVMLSSADNPELVDLFDNFLIGGKESHFVLQNFIGDIIYKTGDSLQGDYSNNAKWMGDILKGDKAYHVQLLGQDDDEFTIQISVPVKYNDYIEGLLSAELSVPIEQGLVPQEHDTHVAFKLVQDNVIVQTPTDNIDIPREISLDLGTPAIRFVYISDDTPIQRAEADLRNIILFVLFAGLVISFILFFILGYISVSQQNTGVKKTMFNRAYMSPMLILLIGLSASVAAYLIVQNQEQVAHEKDFIVNSKSQIKAVDEKIKNSLSALNYLKAFFDASNFVDREEFKTIATPILESNEGLHAISWIPNLKHSQREEFEMLARADGINNFKIKQLNLAGEMIESPAYDNYLPIYYTEQITKNEEILGFNLASNAKHLEALESAMHLNKATVTAPTELVPETGDHKSVLLIYPIYNKAQNNNTVNTQENLLGYVTIELRTTTMLSDALKNWDENSSVHVSDVSDISAPQNIYGEQVESDEDSYGQIIDIGGRKWNINITPQAANGFGNFSLLPWFILGGGLVLSLFSSLILVQQIHRREVVEEMVEQRTRELNSTLEDLQYTNEELEKFAYVASHDLKSPLRGIDSLSRWLEEDLEEQLDEKNKDRLVKLRGRVSRMEHLLDDLLEYSRAGRVLETSETIKTSQLIDEVSELLVVPKGFSIKADDNLKSIIIPRMPLEQVFNNLISNALKHHDKEVGVITVSGKEIDGFYEFSVTDDGPGIPKRFQEKVFEMFQTLKPRDEVEGSGMGLALVKKIIYNYGGWMRLFSEEGKGATFTFTWPKDVTNGSTKNKQKEKTI